MRQKLLAALSLVLSMLLLSACAQTRSVKEHVFEDRRTSITLREWVDKNDVPVPMRYAHPAEFSSEDLKYLLHSVNYQEKRLFGWSEIKNVFTSDDIYRIAPHLQAAFAQAGPDQEILFQLKSAKPGILLPFERISNGTMFVKEGKLNLVFANLDARDEADLYSGDPRNYYAGALWSLVAGDWQALVEGERGIHHNWVELDIARGLKEKQRIEQLLKRRTLQRKAPIQKRPPAEEPNLWEDWKDHPQTQHEPELPDVYFPDELPDYQQQ